MLVVRLAVFICTLWPRWQTKHQKTTANSLAHGSYKIENYCLEGYSGVNAWLKPFKNKQYSAKSQKMEVAMDMYKTTHPEDSTDPDVTKNKSLAVELKNLWYYDGKLNLVTIVDRLS